MTEAYWTAAGFGVPAYGNRCCKRSVVWILTFLLLASGVLLLLSFTAALFTAYTDTVQLASLIVLCVLVCLYWINSLFFSSTGRHLKSRGSKHEVRSKVDKMKSSRPLLWFHAECYHDETHTYTSRDSNGNETTESTTVRVVTHTADGEWAYRSYAEFTESDTAFSRDDLVTKLVCMKCLVFADDSSVQQYESAFRTFCAANTYDSHQDFTRGWSLPHYKKYLLIDQSTGVVSLFISYTAYFLTSLLFCSGCYRVFLGKVSGRAHIRLVKVVSASSFIPGNDRDEAAAHNDTVTVDVAADDARMGDDLDVADSPLPAGWKAKFDPASGKIYYKDASTRTTTFEHPLAKLPPGWSRKRDDDGRVYYRDKNTRTTTYCHPFLAPQVNEASSQETSEYSSSSVF